MERKRLNVMLPTILAITHIRKTEKLHLLGISIMPKYINTKSAPNGKNGQMTLQNVKEETF